MNELFLLPAALKYAPGTQRRPAVKLEDFTPMGPLASWQKVAQGITGVGEDGSTVRILALSDDVVRVTASRDGHEDPPSWALAGYDWAPLEVTILESDTHVSLKTRTLEVRLYRSPLRVEFHERTHGRCVHADWKPMSFHNTGNAIVSTRRLGLDEQFYGLGEKAARLNKRRGRFTMWNSDTPAYFEGTDPLYQSIPFYIGLEKGQAYGVFFDNSYRTDFDFGRLSQDCVTLASDGGPMDYYFFWGPRMAAVIDHYSRLTGCMPLPPMWSLGHQQSRYSYYPQAMLEEIAQAYRDHDLPLDVIHLDIHYLDGYRVFTWHPERFPDPVGLCRRLKAHGVRLVAIVDPGVKHQPTVENGQPALEGEELSKTPYFVFDEGVEHGYFQKRTDGSLYVGEVWPGKSVFVDYTREDARAWWGQLHKAYTDAGVAGIWNDMNEPADFTDQTGARWADVVCDDRGTNSKHDKNRNVFALLEAQATYEGLKCLKPEERPFVITRAGFSGIQRYASVWTGDNNSTWDHLALTIPMFTSMGLSGVTFVGADIGGFMGRGSGELLARWYQAAFLSPFCRNHKCVDAFDQEPWRFGPVYEDVVRRYLKLRYRLLPYLYTHMEEASRTGLPLLRPLVLQYQSDANTYNLDDEFMVGPDLLMAPVLKEGADSRRVYLPTGWWYDFWTDRVLEGPRLVTVEAPLEVCPIYVRGGAILPTGPDQQHTGEKPLDPLSWRVYPDADGRAEGTLYEDDGLSWEYRNGAFRRSRLSCAAADDGYRLTLEVLHDGYSPSRRWAEVLLPSSATVLEVRLNGEVVPTSQGTAYQEPGGGYQLSIRSMV